MFKVKRKGSWGHCLVVVADVPGPALADTPLLHFLAPVEFPPEAQSAGQETDHQQCVIRMAKLAVTWREYERPDEGNRVWMH